MAESDFQRIPLAYAVESLSAYFADRPDVYVSGNLFIYYEEGNPQAVVAPDVFVVLGVEKRDRASYFLWREPKGPDFVIEITSRSTKAQDQWMKRGLYADLNVREYFQYDPTGDYLRPPLQGLRLAGENYQPLKPSHLPDGSIVILSRVLGLELRLGPEGLRFYDPVTGDKLPNYQESEQAREQAESARFAAEARAEREAVARHEAEARIAELEALVRKLQAQQPTSDDSPTS